MAKKAKIPISSGLQEALNSTEKKSSFAHMPQDAWAKLKIIAAVRNQTMTAIMTKLIHQEYETLTLPK